MLTKKDFIIAQILKDQQHAENNGNGFNIEEAFADFLETKNPSFDRIAFFAYINSNNK